MKKTAVRLFALVMAIMMLCSSGVSLFAYTTYVSYTYSVNGAPMISPDAYTPYTVYTTESMLLETPMDNPRDLFVSENNDIYIADTGNNRILVLSQHFKYKMELSSFVNSEGVSDSLNGPCGVFEKAGKIYVADTENNRIVVFDLEGQYLYHLEQPRDDVFPEGSIYKPVAIAVNDAGMIYVISSTTYMGVIVLNSQGVFQSFIGAQQASLSVMDIILRAFQTKEQKKRSASAISTEYNNISIDSSGFLYVTCSSVEEGKQLSAIKSNASSFAPIKKLNSSGTDCLVRNGFYGPGGDIKTASKIVDCALGPEGTYSLIDQEASRIYTYDAQGKLLFAFGNKGQQLGNMQSVSAIAYMGSDLVVLDLQGNNIQVFNRSAYGDTLIQALYNQNERKYSESVQNWRNILMYNNNFDAAYVGMGDAYYRNGRWTEAMEYYKAASDSEGYMMAFKNWRKEWISNYVWVVPIVLVAVIFLIVKYLGYAKKINDRTALSSSKRTFKQEFLYATYLCLHPFDGFWDLKHEKRGSVRAAIVFIALTVLAFTYQGVGSSEIYTGKTAGGNVFVQVLSVLIPVLLWVVANWCLTTLMDGEGTFKDVFVATSYALAPLPLFVIVSTALTHILTSSEGGLVDLLVGIGWIWVGVLLFLGMMITHNYSITKSVVTAVLSVFGIAFIVFITMLFSALMGKIVGFISSVATEIAYHLS